MTIRCFLMRAACFLCLGCRAADPLHREGPASSAEYPPTTRVGAKPAAEDGVVFAYYFHRTIRCQSCLLMETTAAREIEEHFARPMQNGQVVWMSVNIEDPATTALQQQLDVRGNRLVLVRMENGGYKDSKSLDELWGLLRRPDAFSKQLVDEINASLIPVRGG